jgi:hypothetical protein
MVKYHFTYLEVPGKVDKEVTKARKEFGIGDENILVLEFHQYIGNNKPICIIF